MYSLQDFPGWWIPTVITHGEKEHDLKTKPPWCSILNLQGCTSKHLLRRYDWTPKNSPPKRPNLRMYLEDSGNKLLHENAAIHFFWWPYIIKLMLNLKSIVKLSVEYRNTAPPPKKKKETAEAMVGKSYTPSNPRLSWCCENLFHYIIQNESLVVEPTHSKTMIVKTGSPSPKQRRTQRKKKPPPTFHYTTRVKVDD